MKTRYLIVYILILFVSTRVILTIVGVSSRFFFHPAYGQWRDQWNYNPSPILSLWGIWDSGWYLDIAKNGYSTMLQSDLPKRTCCGQANIAFFPLYPTLMQGLGKIVGDDFVAGLLISNFCLIGSAYLLFKIVEKDTGLEQAKRAIKYLFLFPTAFILSGVFSESLFLFLLLLTFYFARKNYWLLGGLSGYLMALTRSVGVFVVIPLIIEYFQKKNFNFSKVRVNIFFLFFIPLGTLTFMFFTYFKFGDFFAYTHVLESSWGERFSNPLIVLLFLVSSNEVLKITALYIISLAAMLIIFNKRLRPSFLVLALLLFFIPMTTGIERILATFRYSVIIFPFFVLFANLTKNKKGDILFSAFLILIQCLFMIHWSNGALII